MTRLFVATALVVMASAALAELRDEEHVVGNKLVKIAVFDTLEIMTVGPSDYEKMQVLSGADVEIMAFAGDADSVALLGQPVVVAEVTGTHSCEDGDARAYYVVTLGDVPAPEGPVTTCQELTMSITPGAVVLEADPMGEGEFWAWSPGKGWRNRLD
jgi:hypothetical protein